MKSYEELLAERNALAAQLVDAFGDGYYDGFLDGAKHHEKTDCNTEPTYLGEDALRCSEIAETEKASQIGISKKQQCLAEIKAEAGRAGYHEALQEYSGATTSAEDYQLANQYATRVRQDEQSGTWLKDSNVNGGKRQGGEK